MEQIRLTVQEMNEHLVALNKAYENKDLDTNQDEYEQFKDYVSMLQVLNCKVTVHEIWENDFVVCEVEIEGVKW